MPTSWPAPVAAGPVRGRRRARLEVGDQPGAAAGRAGRRAGRPSPAPLRTRDTELMVAALRALGVPDRRSTASDVAVDAARRPARPADRRLRAGRHRDALPAAGRRAGRRPGRASTATRAPGSARWAPVLDALRALGARSTIGGDGRLPFTLHGTGALPGGEVVIDASASSQFVSGLLLSARRLRRGRRRCVHDGKPVPSLPHIEMTVPMLRDRGRGGRRRRRRTRWRVAPGPVAARDWTVEPDLSNAAPFLAAAAVTGGGSPSPAGRRAPPSPATRSCRCCARWARRSTLRRRRADGHRARTARAASTSTCTTSAS